MEPMDMDDLRAALAARTPAPCADRRAAVLTQLEKNLEDRQGSVAGGRLTSRTSEQPRAIWQKLEAEMSKWKKRGIFLGTSGLVTAGLAVVVVLSGDHSTPPSAQYLDGLQMERIDLAERHQMAPVDARNKAAVKPVPLVVAPQGQIEAFAAAMTRMAQDTMRIAPALPTPGPDLVHGGMSGDRFEDVVQNSVKIAAEEPVSTFSIDVDTASYSTIRSYLERGQIPPEDAVRIEEMVNYFSYDYPAPEPGGIPFATHVASYETPWNAQTRLVQIGLQGALPEIEERPPLDLVFLVDTSGSMQAPDKLGLLKQSLKLMLPRLRPEDRVAVVTYAGASGVALELTNASDTAVISAALDGLSARGSTAGAAGLKAAYGLLERVTDDGRIGRVILATDGDFNVGMSSADEMKDFIADKRDTGAYLSVLGFGHGNYNDALMQALAQNGNGHAAYIDSLTEARKALGDQLTGALFPIAGDVKVQVEFNPSVVGEYRLIGYETRSLAREDFNNDKVDAGDLGAGHSVTALYEVTPVGSPALLNDPLRYGSAPVSTGDAGEIGYVKLRWKAPGEAKSEITSTPIPFAADGPSGEHRFAAAIAGFGQILKGGTYLGDWGIAQAIDLASGHDGVDEWGYRAEAVRLMGLYQDLKSIE